MRKLGLSLALLVGAAAPVAAQSMPWKAEVGIRLNYTKTTINGTDITTAGMPSNGFLSLGGVAGLYGVIPVNDKFAIEPAVGMYDVDFGGTPVTQGDMAVRVLYSVAGPFYVAAGPTLSFARISGTQSSVWGVQGAAGYRRHLSGALSGRAEVYVQKDGKSSLVSDEKPSSWGLLVSLGITPGAPMNRGGSATRLWTPMIGIQGGYSHLTITNGGTDVSSFSVPGSSNMVLIAGSEAPLLAVAPIFAVIPIGERIAVEPSLAYSSYKIEGSGNGHALGLGVRANYAFNRTLYAGLSYDMTSYGGGSGSQLDGLDATTGAGVQAGVRFPLVSGFTGRTEISYRKLSADDTFIGDHTITTLSFALMAPLK
jgi:hypothetical protein